MNSIKEDDYQMAIISVEVFFDIVISISMMTHRFNEIPEKSEFHDMRYFGITVNPNKYSGCYTNVEKAVKEIIPENFPNSIISKCDSILVWNLKKENHMEKFKEKVELLLTKNSFLEFVETNYNETSSDPETNRVLGEIFTSPRIQWAFTKTNENLNKFNLENLSLKVIFKRIFKKYFVCTYHLRLIENNLFNILILMGSEEIMILRQNCFLGFHKLRLPPILINELKSFFPDDETLQIWSSHQPSNFLL